MGLRFGLLGTGYWATKTQAAGLARHPDAELVGVWGRHSERTARLADRYGVRAYADVDALIADVDAVSMALPPDVQAGLALRAARAGRHLLLDKPLAFDTAAADAIVRAVERQGLASLVFFTNRFFGNVDAVLRRAAAAGGWDGARATVHVSIFQPGGPYSTSTWRREWGALWDVGPHVLSVLLPVLGRVTEVAAMAGPRNAVLLLLRHAGGAASTISLALDAPAAATANEIVFFGGDGHLRVPAGDGSDVDAFGAAIGALVLASQGGSRHPCDAAFGREIVAVLEAAAAARRSGVTRCR